MTTTNTTYTFYLATFISATDVASFDKTKDTTLLKQRAIATEDSPAHIKQEMKNQGLVLLALETEQMVLNKLSLINELKENFENRVKLKVK